MATGAKVAGLVILAACVTGELSPEPHGGQNIHAHGGHENKRSVVLRPVVRRRSDGAAPEPLANDEDGMAGCENRVDLCEHRTDDGVCRRRERLCRWVDRECVPQGPPGKESSSEFLKMIDRKISAVQKDVGELRRAPHPACGHTLTRPVATLSQPMGEGHLPSAEKVEPASDDEARRLFALLKALETESYYRKAPVTRVFQLYCLEGLTRDKVAKKCRCAPSLVTLRLRAIESRLGRKASALRQISDHFDRIADALSDDRARHIHRPNALDDPGDDDDDAV